MGSRSKRRRREALLSDLLESAPPWLREKPIRVRYNHPRKISSALVELVRPFMAEVETLDEFRALAGAGIVAWNSSVVDERPEHLRRLLSECGIQGSELANVVVTLANRKKLLFPDDTRIVVSWQATRRGRDAFHLSAAATETDSR